MKNKTHKRQGNNDPAPEANNELSRPGGKKKKNNL